jgi:CubicO group peptidase (beta-lactamase class C family)
MRARLFVIAISTLIFVGPADARPVLTTGEPSSAGMSAAVLREGVALFEQAVAKSELQGVVLLVARHGKIVLCEPVGWRDRDRQLPMTRDTLFHVASNTKPVVATAVLMLAEQGKLDIHAAALSYLPSFDSPKSNAITVRQLLTHTSGFRIPTIFVPPLLAKSAEHADWPNLRAEVDRFGPIGAAVTPGTSYSYSNPGYNTLGAIVETVSRQPLTDFLNERIYRPLGMTESAHQGRPGLTERRACIYRKKDDKWEVAYRPGDAPTYPFARGSGGLITSAGDYAKFLQLYLSGGTYAGRRLLSRESVRAATAPQTCSIYSADELKKRTDFYGYGWQVSADGTYGHAGSDGTYAWVDPERDLTGIVFTQSTGGHSPRDEFVKLVRRAADVGAAASNP